MRTFKNVVVFAFILMLFVTMTVECNNTSTSAKAIWKVAFAGPDSMPICQAFYKFEKELEERVNDIDVVIYPNAQLGGSPDDLLGGLQRHSIEICEISLGNTVEFSDTFIPVNIPYLFLKKEDAFTFIDSEMAKKTMANRFEADTGLMILGYFDSGFRNVTNNVRVIREPSDLKGIKIRTMSNPIHMKAFKEFGASPAPMAFSELFTALQQGVMDGQENPIIIIAMTGISDVQKYMALTEHVYDFIGVYTSRDFFNSLDDNHQTALIESMEIAIKYQRKIQEEMEVEALKTLIEKPNFEVLKLTNDQKLKFREVSQPVWTEVKESMKDSNYFSLVVDKILEIEK